MKVYLHERRIARLGRMLLTLVLCGSLILPAAVACTPEDKNGAETQNTTAESATGSVTETPTETPTEAPTEVPTETEPETESPEEAARKKQEAMDALYAATEDKLLPIGGWSTPAPGLRDGYTGVEGSYDAAWQVLADAHVNFMITLEEWSSPSWVLESAASASKAGIKLWYHDAVNDPDLAIERIQSILASEYADVLDAAYIKDEPTYDGIADVKASAEKVRAALSGENLTVLANLLPTYAASNLIGGNYRTYVKDYLAQVKPDILMFDYYPFVGGDTTSSMLVNNAIAIEEANAAGVPLYTFVQSSDINKSGVEPTLEQLRLNANINLAMGSKGFAYFILCEFSENWGYSPMLTFDGQKTAMFDKVKTLNEELLAMKGVYLDYTCHGVAVTSQTIEKTMERGDAGSFLLNAYDVMSGVESKGKVLVGCFDDGEGSVGYYLVNLDYRRGTKVTLHFDTESARSFTLWGSEGLEDMGTLSFDMDFSLSGGEGLFLRVDAPEVP